MFINLVGKTTTTNAFGRIPELDLSALSPKKAFIIGTLEKEIQLSFAKRVRDTLPADYHPLIPPSKENEIPEFKYTIRQRRPRSATDAPKEGS